MIRAVACILLMMGVAALGMYAVDSVAAYPPAATAAYAVGLLFGWLSFVAGWLVGKEL